jgi:hypothetical protein
VESEQFLGCAFTIRLGKAVIIAKVHVLKQSEYGNEIRKVKALCHDATAVK